MDKTTTTQLDFSGITEDSFGIRFITPEGQKNLGISGYYDHIVYITGLPEVLVYTWLAYQTGIEGVSLIESSYDYDSLHVDIELKITPGYQFFEFDFTELNRYYFDREDSKFNWG